MAEKTMPKIKIKYILKRKKVDAQFIKFLHQKKGQ